MSNYSFGPDGWMPDDYMCPACHGPESGPHLSPCVVDDHDLELMAAEALEREGTAGLFLCQYERLLSGE